MSVSPSNSLFKRMYDPSLRVLGCEDGASCVPGAVAVPAVGAVCRQHGACACAAVFPSDSLETSVPMETVKKNTV